MKEFTSTVTLIFDLNNLEAESKEDYDMGEYDCLCEICFDINNSEGKIKWKDNKNPFKCESVATKV